MNEIRPKKSELNQQCQKTYNGFVLNLGKYQHD